MKNDPIYQEIWYSSINKEGEKEDLEEIKKHSEESFEVFKEKLNKADDYICTFEKEYFTTDWYQSEQEQVIDKTKKHHEILWQSHS